MNSELTRMNESHEIEQTADAMRRIVARRQLGALEACEALSGHQLACQRIRSLRFSPPGHLHAAILTLAEGLEGTGSEPVDDPDFCEQVLRLELRKFRSEFYSIAPTERKDIWNQLNARVEKFPQFQWQLSRLKDGLAVIRPPDENGTRVATLARSLCDILVMSPAAYVAALQQVCETALIKDNGVAIGDDYLEMSRVMPEIGDLRPAMMLPETLRRIRDEAKNCPERLSNYTPQIFGTSKKEQSGFSTAFRVILVIVLSVACGLFIAAAFAGFVANGRKFHGPMSPNEKYGFGRLETTSGSIPMPNAAPSDASDPVENPTVEEAEPDHATAEKSWDFRMLPNGRLEAKESWRDWPEDDKAKKTLEPLPLSVIKELKDWRAHQAEAKAGKK